MKLVAHSHYKRVPHYAIWAQRRMGFTGKSLQPGYRSCIPRKRHSDVTTHIHKLEGCWRQRRTIFPHEFMYKSSWAACWNNIMNWSQNSGACRSSKEHTDCSTRWERQYHGQHLRLHYQRRTKGKYQKSGIEYMGGLQMVQEQFSGKGVGFFQIGGGIAGDSDLRSTDDVPGPGVARCTLLEFFCQVSDSTTSRFYSGAVPTKNHLGKWILTRPSIVESDATIVCRSFSPDFRLVVTYYQLQSL